MASGNFHVNKNKIAEKHGAIRKLIHRLKWRDTGQFSSIDRRYLDTLLFAQSLLPLPKDNILSALPKETQNLAEVTP